MSYTIKQCVTFKNPVKDDFDSVTIKNQNVATLTMTDRPIGIVSHLEINQLGAIAKATGKL